MLATTPSRSAQIRAQVGHPVIDSSRGCRAKPGHRKLVVIRYQIPTRGKRLEAELWRCSYAYRRLIA